MANVEDTIRSAVPGGNVSKPLMLALLALLGSGALFKGGGKGSTETPSSQPASTEGAGGGLGGLLDKLRKGGLADAANLGRFRAKSASFAGAARIGARPRYHQEARPANRPLRGRAYQAAVAGSAGGHGQAYPGRPSADVSGAL
jgi:hypothetical protein